MNNQCQIDPIETEFNLVGPCPHRPKVSWSMKALIRIKNKLSWPVKTQTMEFKWKK